MQDYSNYTIFITPFIDLSEYVAFTQKIDQVY